MLRERLARKSLEALREEASRLEVDATGDQGQLIERLVNHYENFGASQQWIAGMSAEASARVATSTASETGQSTATNPPSASYATSAPSGGWQGLIQALVQQNALQQQQFLEGQRRMLDYFGNHLTATLRPLVAEITATRAASTASDTAPSELPRVNRMTSSGASSPTMHEHSLARLIGSQIPEFSGTENENVEKWLNRVSHVGRLYQASDDLILLTSTSRLQGEAKKWYHRQSNETISSWALVQRSMREFFAHKSPYPVLMDRIYSRKWHSNKERFVDYSNDKLDLAYSLSLQDVDLIHLLASGISDLSLRAVAMSSKDESVNQFIDRMRAITETIVTNDTRPPRSGPKVNTKRTEDPNKRLSIECSYCKKKGHLLKDCRARLKRCFQCGREGHLVAECPSAGSSRARNQSTNQRAPSSSQLATPVASALTIIDKSDLNISDKDKLPYTQVVKMKDKPCDVQALVDTGSAVNLMRKSLYDSLLSDVALDHVNRCEVKGVNDSPVMVLGKLSCSISLKEYLSRSWIIDFLVVENNTMQHDLILGREFLNRAQLQMIYFNGEVQFSITNEVLLIDTFDIRNQYDLVSQSLDEDLDPQIRHKLFETFTEVAEQTVEMQEQSELVRITLKDDSTFAYLPRRMSVLEKRELDKITDDLLQRGIIKESKSPFCSRVVLVQKKSGKYRMCVDLRPLNQRVHHVKYPFPIIEEQMEKLYGKKVFTNLDLKDGFLQIRVHPQDTKYLAFATPTGQYEFTRLPFGYVNSPAEFQRRISQIFLPLVRSNKLIIYMDDLLIATVSYEENLEILKEVLLILKKHNLELNLAKCSFLRKNLEYLGYMLTGNGITMSDRHTSAIMGYPKPRTVHQLRSFLGLTGYFRKFIKNYSRKVEPLQRLLKKSSTFEWSATCEQAFVNLKKELTCYPVLRLYNATAYTELHTDASMLGIGAIMLQRQSDGKLAPIAYYSRSTTDAEKKYHSYELETLAVIKALERFHIYLHGISFKIVTDCSALTLALRKADLNPRIARWSLKMQNYTFEIVHRPSNRMKHVDALSRQVLLIDVISLEDELVYRQLSDPVIQKLAESLEVEDNSRFLLFNGLVFRIDNEQHLFYVPESMIDNIIRIYHDDMGHVGIEKVIKGIRLHYWFPNMKMRVKTHIDNCIKCLVYNLTPHRFEGELQLLEKGKEPLLTWHMDHFGPLEETNDGYKHIIVVIDAFAKYVWLFATKSTGAKECVAHLENLFHLVGTPNRIITDRGTCYTSEIFTEYLKRKQVQHIKVATAAPWANGQVERVNRFIKNTLAKIVKSPKDWKSKLEQLQYVLNNTFNKAVNATPCKLMYGIEQRNQTDSELQSFLDSLINVDSDLNKEREQKRQQAHEANQLLQAYNKERYDKVHRKPSQYSVGDLVFLRDTTSKPGINQKLKSKYKGPYRIKAVLNKNRYVVCDVPGLSLSNHPYNGIVSPDRLKPWIKQKELLAEV